MVVDACIKYAAFNIKKTTMLI